MPKTQKTSNTKSHKKSQKKPMEVEYEARFLEINKDDLIKKLKDIGASLKQKLTLYKRSVFNLCDIKKGYVRVRDEGDKITMTAKLYKDPKFPEEYELQLKEGFENGRSFLHALNLDEKAYHETMREKWSIFKSGRKGTKDNNKIELCEIAIDCIPGLPMYVEVECKTQSDLNKCIKMLELDKSKMRFGGYGKVYVEYYGMTENEINNIVPSLTFENIENELEKYVHKNKELLSDIARSHLEIYNSIAH
jgi:adenylate cyclase class 2